MVGDGKKKKSEKKGAKKKAPVDATSISSSKDLKEFLNKIRDDLVEERAAIIHAVSVMNYVLTMPDIYQYLDKDSKEIARDIWLRIKQVGVQLKNPRLLFDADEEVFHTGP